MKRLTLFTILVILSTISIYGHTCISKGFEAEIQKHLQLVSHIFTSKRYSEVKSSVDGRVVLRLSSIDLGKPNVDLNNLPKNWTTIKKLLEAGTTNCKLMQLGYAPFGPDGKQIEVHHLYAKEPGPVAELEYSIHKGQSKFLHESGKLSFRKDDAKAQSWNTFRSSYWKRRSKTFGNKCK